MANLSIINILLGLMPDVILKCYACRVFFCLFILILPCLGIKLMGYSSFRGFLREQFPNLKLDGAAVTPAKHNSTASNVASSSTAASMKIEENLNSLSQ